MGSSCRGGTGGGGRVCSLCCCRGGSLCSGVTVGLELVILNVGIAGVCRATAEHKVVVDQTGRSSGSAGPIAD